MHIPKSLQPVSLMLTLSGLGFALLAVAAPDLLATLYRLAGPGTVTEVGPAARLGAGIYGGLLVGWGLHFWMAARGASVCRAGSVGLLAWFLVDSLASVATGYPWNAASNALFLLMFFPVLRVGLRRAR